VPSRLTLVGGLRVHWWERGRGRPIVLVHGIGVSGRYLRPTARLLAVDSHVLVPDLPGFGNSERPDRPLGVRGLARALAQWLDRVGVERAAFVGNSLGCQTLVELALTEPRRVEALVLVGPTVDREARSLAQQGARLVRDMLREPPGLIAIVAFDYAVFGPLRLVATARSALADRIEEKVARVTTPTLVVRGERDVLVSQAFVEELVARLPQGELAVVPGAPHAVNYADPQALARLTRSFLSERSAPASDWPPRSTGS
jgi:2-hydroxy-6-oxonona-2,4-dienedioate hydrolase